MIEQLNRRTWSAPSVVAEFRGLRSWTDPGEQAALERIAPDIRNQPVLDVGVGVGRTTTFLRLATDDYVGIDFLPEMVDACRAAHPRADVRLGDARDLSAFADDSFALVMFSFNGIDAVDHSGRQQVLREFARVTRPGGWVLYSTHNKLGPGYRQHPRQEYVHLGPPLVYRALRYVARIPVDGRDRVTAYRNWWRNRRLEADHGSWGLSTLSAHEFNLVVHFTTLDGDLELLREAGLCAVDVYDREQGLPLDRSVPTATRWFQILAQKPGATGS